MRVAVAFLMVLSTACVRVVPRRSTATIERSSRSESAPVVSVPQDAPTQPLPVEAPESPATGVWWEPFRDAPATSSFEGRASYYSDALAGRPTATGEPYEPRELTAASRTLAFGTVLRVTRVETGATVIVRVNDRGPFGDRRRVLDLSRAAAEALGMIRAGVVEVRVEVVGAVSR